MSNSQTHIIIKLKVAKRTLHYLEKKKPSKGSLEIISMLFENLDEELFLYFKKKKSLALESFNILLNTS